MPDRLARLPRAWQTARATVRSGNAPRIAALLGGLLALPVLFRPLSPPATRVPAEDAALVNGEPILMNDYTAQVENQFSTPFDEASPAQQQRVLHDMIDEELTVQRALALDLPENDEDLRQAMTNSVEAQVNAPVLAQRADDAALHAFYEAHHADYATDGTMRVRNIVLHVGGYRNADQSTSQAIADAAQAAYQLRAGTPEQQVMDHFGFVDAPKSDTGAQFDFAARQHLGAALYKIADTMSSGDVSDPVASADGVHLLLMRERQPPRTAPFDRVRASVYTAYRQAAEASAQAANLAFLRRNARILITPGLSE